jgi:DNA-binding Xre family transcriptional regulator
MKKKHDKIKDTRGIITERIAALLASRDMLPLHLAHKTGIANETIYRCLNGKRKWNLDHLELIAPVLGVALGDLVQEIVMIPRAGEIRGGQGPPQAQILHPSPEQGSRALRLKEDKETLAKMYDLTIEDRSMMPAFPPGTHLFAQRETSDTIKNENFVVYWSDDGQTYIRQIFFSPDQIVLRSLTQGVPDKVLPKKHIALCDKILRVEFPA